MSHSSQHDDLPLLSEKQQELRDRLRRAVTTLACDIGERHVWEPRALGRAAEWAEAHLGAFGYEVSRQTYAAGGVDVANLIVEIPGASSPGEFVVVGAHYDSFPGSPGANDNATGIAALLEIARASKESPPARTLRLVAFVNEEPPHFQTDQMGSLRYARRCRRRGEQLAAALVLETIGYYTDEPGSQEYPSPELSMRYPDTGNFIGFIGNTDSAALVDRCVDAFRRHTAFPCEGAAAPESLPGVGWSDHWAFWQAGYAAAMVTDTAPFRYPQYHTADDTPDRIDFDRFALVAEGLIAVVGALVLSPQ